MTTASINPWAEMAAELASEANWQLLAEYCKARSFNLRDRAAMIAEQIIEVARTWSFEERKRFGLWIMHRTGSAMERGGKLRYDLRYSIGGDGLFAPRRVVEATLLPSLLEWCEREPTNPEPHFWLGLYGNNPGRYLREAFRLNPHFSPAGVALATLIVRGIEYNQHELPSGYLGDPVDDLRSLGEAEAFLANVIDPSVRVPVEERVTILKQIARDWIGLRDQMRSLGWTERLLIWPARPQDHTTRNS
jgi:hypothetical protein